MKRPENVLCQAVIRSTACTHTNWYTLQVAALAPLALLFVPEARCSHLVITHFDDME